jgi:serine/threonine-protein kinase RsbW
MDIKTDTSLPGIVVVRLSGEMDLYHANRLKDTVVAHWSDGARRIVVDLGELTYIDSSGIGTLLYVTTAGRRRNAAVRFARARGSVLKVITLTRLAGFLPLADSIDEAVEAVSSWETGENRQRPHVGIVVDPESPLLVTEGMYHKTFHIGFPQIRRLSNLIAQQAPTEVQEFNILEQQISELIKNAVKHGNKNDPSKALDVWFSFSRSHAHLIVKDQGTGFTEIERWNEFYQKKMECYRTHDFDRMMDYLSFRTEDSDDYDGGNAMFAAVEYWNQGVVFSGARNTVGVKRTFSLPETG